MQELVRKVAKDFGIPVRPQGNLWTMLDDRGDLPHVHLRLSVDGDTLRFSTPTCNNVGTLRISISPNLHIVNVEIDGMNKLNSIKGADKLFGLYFELLAMHTDVNYMRVGTQYNKRELSPSVLDKVTVVQQPNDRFIARLLGVPVAIGKYVDGKAKVVNWITDATPTTGTAIPVTSNTANFIFDIIENIATREYYDVKKDINYASFEALFNYDTLADDWFESVVDMSSMMHIMPNHFIKLNEIELCVHWHHTKLNANHVMLQVQGNGLRVATVCGHWLVIEAKNVRPLNPRATLAGVKDIIKCGWIRG